VTIAVSIRPKGADASRPDGTTFVLGAMYRTYRASGRAGRHGTACVAIGPKEEDAARRRSGVRILATSTSYIVVHKTGVTGEP
jgi:hypothetical protein